MLTPELRLAGWREMPSDDVRRAWEAKDGRWSVLLAIGGGDYHGPIVASARNTEGTAFRDGLWRPVNPQTWDYDPRGWGLSPVPLSPQCFMDEIEAWAVVEPWIEALAKADQPPPGDIQIERWGLCGLNGQQPNGGIVILWVNNQIRAQAVVVRDCSNFSVLNIATFDDRGPDVNT